MAAPAFNIVKCSDGIFRSKTTSSIYKKRKKTQTEYDPKNDRFIGMNWCQKKHKWTNINNPLLMIDGKLMQQKQCLNITKIRWSPKNLCLQNQRGVKTKVSIPKDTVIGIYHGVEFLDNEIQDKNPGNKNFYAFEFVHNDKHIIVDACALGLQNVAHNTMAMINDFRKDTSKMSPTKEEFKAQRQNCVFKPVLIEGWIYILVCTARRIQKNEYVLIHYNCTWNNNL